MNYTGATKVLLFGSTFLLGFLVGQGFGTNDVVVRPKYPQRIFTFPKPLIVDCACKLIPPEGSRRKTTQISWTERYQ